MESIKTGLTKNYVEYWTVKQGIKEAAQNIAYGGKKAGVMPRIYYQNGQGVMEDTFTGFEKRYLYLGESAQRDDADGLGNFGEGWKMFLLVAARNKLQHKVETVGFSFWGEMVETPHGVEVLEIKVEENARQVGTKVTIECSREDFYGAVQSFAYLQGIEVSPDSVVEGRRGELWVKGIRIEDNDDTNPLKLRFAYNLQNADVMNRDRSQVKAQEVYRQIKTIVFKANREFIEEYVAEAMLATDKPDMPEDLNRGPNVYPWEGEKVAVWKEVIAKAHKTTAEKLVISSGNTSVDTEAEYRGYRVIKLPTNWNYDLSYLFKRADDVVKTGFNTEAAEISKEERKILARAKKDAKAALKLQSVNELPEIIVAENLTSSDGVTKANGIWDAETKTIYLSHEIFYSQRQVTETLIHEAIHWKTGAADNSQEFTMALQTAITNLLGY